ncbi:hypothetical protein B1C78_06620 [Thioalkalivibrio denitrificans]|uniref:Uncharacterized protein n=1 Tax=Thioalkalivibrio denitrificans TaxID=108003 RepID=A0A1V3NJV7_9GAMM|nr:hypothetical protein [Thioalkalivibrio denitrificans]OOG25387.1 hypothetical protein B1C78_06620 [Thioalkalivibrio denitrificans]
MKGSYFITADFLLAAILTAFALYALAMLIARWAPASQSMNLLQRFAICIITIAAGFASFIAFLTSIAVGLWQWQIGLPGTVAVTACLVFGLSVVHWAAMRRSEAVWFCDLEEQVRLNGLRARWRREERESVRAPVASDLVSSLKERGRKGARVYF